MTTTGNGDDKPGTPKLGREVEVSNPLRSDHDALADVKQLGLFAGIASLSYVFWIVGGMEMIERCAFYAVKGVTSLYATAPASEGGLGITASQYGTIGVVWAAVQSFLPVFTGGLSDRYGYKPTIFVSTVVKIIGYLIMGFFPHYLGFMAGAIVLATGTAIFKPGIQGTLVKSTNRENSSIAWGIFYQTVNVGGWLGPLVAAFVRPYGWHYLFYVAAVIICINFLFLLTYKEVGKEERLARDKKFEDGTVHRESLWRESIREVTKPHVWRYLLLFSGFWFMFNSLFDVLPLHIRDWVDTSDVVNSIFGSDGTRNSFFQFVLGLNKEGTDFMPEGMLNVNAGLITLTCFAVAYLSGKMRATTSMVVGTIFASAALYFCGSATMGWAMLMAIAIFSVGEMLSSPKFSEFIGNFAPADKKAMYLGFSQIPLGIGWTLEFLLAPRLYDHYASKERFAREMLSDRGMAADLIKDIPNGDAFKKLVEFTGQSASDLTDILYKAHNIGLMWDIMAIVGVFSALGIYWYGRWILTLRKK